MTILPGIILIGYKERIVVSKKVSVFLEAARIARDSLYFSIVSVSVTFLVFILFRRIHGISFSALIDLLFGVTPVAEDRYKLIWFIFIFTGFNLLFPHLWGQLKLKKNLTEVITNKTSWSLTFEKFQEAVQDIEKNGYKGKVVVTVITQLGVYKGNLEQYSVEFPYEEREIALSEVSLYNSLGDLEKLESRKSKIEMIVVPGSVIQSIFVEAEKI